MLLSESGIGSCFGIRRLYQVWLGGTVFGLQVPMLRYRAYLRFSICWLQSRTTSVLVLVEGLLPELQRKGYFFLHSCKSV